MDNPLLSEAAMFRVFLLVFLAALPVVVLGLIGGPAWGVVALLGELGFAIGFLWHRRRERAATAAANGAVAADGGDQGERA